MKTRSAMLSVLFLSVCLGLSSCGGGSGSGTNGYITADLLTADELGSGFNSDYLPDKSSIKQQSGKIDVCLDFDGNQHGWNAVATEYSRLHSGAVTVNINTNFSGSTYGERLNNELINYSATDWDICEGNLGYGNTNTACLAIKEIANTVNSYCGKNVIWSSVCDDNAFKNVESDSTDTYIINSETMQSCWFVNDVAFSAAVEKGYLNANGEAAYPVTWDDLMNLCTKMEEAGYEHPLGISLSSSSIKSTQFTWLLRIYGDYYYRQYYPYIMAADYWDKYSPTKTNVEFLDGYGVKNCKIANILLDEETEFGPGYVGFKSEVYKDFVSNLYKMKDHLISDVASTEFNDLRDQFRTQSLGKGSAQIVLDYLGNGLLFGKTASDSFSAGYFDYPTMKSDYVPASTITRDIGGNGGFISIIKHVGNTAQNNLNIDFIKFFLSPYGQTIYYKGLAQNNVAPKGLSTVSNDLVVIPDEWKNYFTSASSSVTFNGNVDGDLFLSWGVRFFSGYTNTESCIVEKWRNLLIKNIGSGALTVNSFSNQWADAVYKDYLLKCIDCQWNQDMYTNPHGGY